MESETSRAKPQPTLRGYTAWVFNRLVKVKGRKEGTVAAWIIDRWVDENPETLKREFGITREQFLSRGGEGVVIRHPSSAKKIDEGHNA